MTGFERRNTNDRYRIEWEPDDSQAALDALVAVDATGVTSESDLPEDGLVDLDDQPDVQAAVREEYQRLTDDSTQSAGG